MDVFDLDEIKEIQVRTLDGRDLVYRGAGMGKLVRLILESQRTLSRTATKKKPSKVTVIEQDADSDDDNGEEEHFVKPSRTKSKASKVVNGGTGYVSTELNYTSTPSGSGGKSAVDLAREMQRQAEQASGLKF